MSPPRRRLPRRQRLLAVTTGLAVAFLAAVAGFLLWSEDESETYRPGAEVEGVTSGLSRDLPADYPPVSFTDVTEAAGLEVRHFPAERTSQLPEDMGSGVAWGDFDADGWPDLYVVNAGPLVDVPATEASGEDDVVPPAGTDARAHLYRNLGNGRFEEMAVRAGVDHRGVGMAAAWADYDDDGLLDLLVTAYGGLTLYRNAGDGTFEDVTRAAGLDGHEGFRAGAAWGDWDRDGDLDLYVTGYVRYAGRPPGGSLRQYDAEVPASLNPSAFEPAPNLLFVNQGDGSFVERAGELGVRGSSGRSLEAVWTDVDADGWLDLYVANDVSDNALYRNRGDGFFDDVSHEARVADYRGAMGLAVGDWNGDLDQDLYITHWIAQENALYDNLGSPSADRPGDGPGSPPARPRFTDVADRVGLGQAALDYVGFATGFLDYDNDGHLDLYVVNGSTLPVRDDPRRLTPMPDQLFWNAGPDRGFFDVSSVSGPPFRTSAVGRGGAVADYDRDGDLDLAVLDHGERIRLLRNDGGDRNHWLQVRLVGEASPNPPVGARVRIVVDGRSQVREVATQGSYLSQDEPVASFGLGSAARADSVVVRWPGGEVATYGPLAADRRWRLREGNGGPVAESSPTADTSSRAGAPSGPRAGRREGEPGRFAAGAGTASASGDEREATRTFWELYRSATSERLAGRSDAAATRYRRALELRPGHEDALYQLGNAELERGRYPEAAAAWLELLRVNPRSARAHAQLGAMYACGAREDPVPDLAGARAHLEAALEINREETGPRLHLARLALVEGRADDAARQASLVVGSHPGSADGHYLAGYAAWVRGDGERALASYRRAAQALASEAQTPEGPREGDTRGGADLVSARGACAGPPPAEALLEPVDAPPTEEDADRSLRPAMERSYAAFSSILDETRGRLDPGDGPGSSDPDRPS